MPAPLSNPFSSLLSPNVLSLCLLTSVYFLLFSFGYSIDAQCQALLEWRNSLNSSTNVLKSWDPSHPTPCNWFGITCNSQGRVIEIRLKSVDLQGPFPSNFQPLQSLKTLVLSSSNLTGVIPEELGDYLELRVLDIRDNYVTGEIPWEICRLIKLQTLFLNTNFLEGQIPPDIGNLANLRYLTLFDNHLSGVIPKSIGKLQNLEIFRAGGNQKLKGELPWEIGNCTNLAVIGLAETSISGSLPASIGMLKMIQTIGIYSSLLSGSIPEEIGNCSQLQKLYLYQNSISGPIPRQIGELRKLQTLLLWQNSLAGTIPNVLGSCTELKVVDLSENLLTGSIPASFGGLLKLEELQMSVNQLSGTLPSEISNCTSLGHLEIDNNNLSGGIPIQIGKLKRLTIFFAWKNNFTGNIPESLSECEKLEALDLSYNQLSGPIPKQIFALRSLTKVLLLSNDLSAFLPSEIGNCTNLYRFRVNDNRLAGTIPPEIGNLKRLNFLDMSNNHFVGNIPPSMSQCGNLEFLDLHSNGIIGSLPKSLPKNLQFLDISGNSLTGFLNPDIGSLTELTKLNLGRNQLSGKIPAEILSCSKLQLIDLGNNGFSGEIPKELAQIPSLEISLNLSCNQFTGEIPSEFSGLSKLGILDLSHNMLTGNLDILTSLQNLVSLNVSSNRFSGELPNTPFFHKLPLDDLTGNPALYITGGAVTPAGSMGSTGIARSMRMKTALSIVVSASALIVLLGIYIFVRARFADTRSMKYETWELTLYQKLEFSIDDIVGNLTSANVIGTGSSGVVFRVSIPNGQTLAVKKMWSSDESAGTFWSEIHTLGSIRHKNIVRLLGWGSNQNLKLLFYDYLPNGSLGSILHGAGKGGGGGGGVEWEERYGIVQGVAYALAYLHHDCVPPIIHGDVKAMNVLLGPRLEPYLADFGLARLLVSSSSTEIETSKQNQRPLHLAGSYGYMAPEHGTMARISEKSDVYSFGVVLMEVLTGRHPLDPTLPGGAHLVQWVRDHLQREGDPVDILDPKLRGRPDPLIHEMLQTLAVSFLCISARAHDRPTMKDVVAMLVEIRRADTIRSDSDLLKGSWSPPPPRKIVTQESSNCSYYAFSDVSV